MFYPSIDTKQKFQKATIDTKLKPANPLRKNYSNEIELKIKCIKTKRNVKYNVPLIILLVQLRGLFGIV